MWWVGEKKFPVVTLRFYLKLSFPRQTELCELINLAIARENIHVIPCFKKESFFDSSRQSSQQKLMKYSLSGKTTTIQNLKKKTEKDVYKTIQYNLFFGEAFS